LTVSFREKGEMGDSVFEFPALKRKREGPKEERTRVARANEDIPLIKDYRRQKEGAGRALVQLSYPKTHPVQPGGEEKPDLIKQLRKSHPKEILLQAGVKKSGSE